MLEFLTILIREILISEKNNKFIKEYEGIITIVLVLTNKKRINVCFLLLDLICLLRKAKIVI